MSVVKVDFQSNSKPTKIIVNIKGEQIIFHPFFRQTSNWLEVLEWTYTKDCLDQKQKTNIHYLNKIWAIVNQFSKSPNVQLDEDYMYSFFRDINAAGIIPPTDMLDGGHPTVFVPDCLKAQKVKLIGNLRRSLTKRRANKKAKAAKQVTKPQQQKEYDNNIDLSKAESLELHVETNKIKFRVGRKRFECEALDFDKKLSEQDNFSKLGRKTKEEVVYYKDKHDIAKQAGENVFTACCLVRQTHGSGKSYNHNDFLCVVGAKANVTLIDNGIVVCSDLAAVIN